MNTDFIDCRHTGICCVFMGMYLTMLLCFHWIVFLIHIKCCLVIG